MGWVVIAAAGLAVALTVAFWKKIVQWANQHVANWLGEWVSDEAKEAFLLLLAGLDRPIVMIQRATAVVQDKLISARLLFRQSGTEYEKLVKAEIEQEDGSIIDLEAADVVPWHELPDEVREKFIRRQAHSVEMELKLKDS
jgi:hypothetical protein